MSVLPELICLLPFTAAVARQQLMPAYSYLYPKHIRQSMNRLFIYIHEFKKDYAFDQLTTTSSKRNDNSRTVSLTTEPTARS